MNNAALERANCLNCGTPLAGTYCSHCGQKDTPANPTFRDLAQDLAQELLNLDGKIYFDFAHTWGRSSRKPQDLRYLAPYLEALYSTSWRASAGRMVIVRHARGAIAGLTRAS